MHPYMHACIYLPNLLLCVWLCLFTWCFARCLPPAQWNPVIFRAEAGSILNTCNREERKTRHALAVNWLDVNNSRSVIYGTENPGADPGGLLLLLTFSASLLKIDDCIKFFHRKENCLGFTDNQDQSQCSDITASTVIRWYGTIHANFFSDVFVFFVRVDGSCQPGSEQEVTSKRG